MRHVKLYNSSRCRLTVKLLKAKLLRITVYLHLLAFPFVGVFFWQNTYAGTKGLFQLRVYEIRVGRNP